MVQATLAAQAAFMAFVLLLGEPASITEESRREPHAPTEPTRLRCRHHFGGVHD